MATKAAGAKKYLPSSNKGGRWRPFKQHQGVGPRNQRGRPFTFVRLCWAAYRA